MTVPGPSLEPAPLPRGSRRPRRMWLVLGVLALVLLAAVGVVLGIGAGLFHPGGGPGVPSFPSLAAQPDRSLHGTVAYFADDTRCIRIVAASGQPSRNVLCLSKRDLAVRPEQGIKPAGPQLVWLPGDRLEVTMFLWRPRPGVPPEYRAGWQKIVDVRTGRVDTVPSARVPATPDPDAGPTVSPHGARVGYTFDAGNGRVTVTLTDTTGTRTLLSARGPGEYTYRFGPVYWAPNWQWIAASDDGRILVITPGTPSSTRVLVTGSGGGAGGGTAGPPFAVTGSDLLTAGK